MSDFVENQLEIITEWGIAKCFSRYNDYCQIVHIDEKIGEGYLEVYDFEKYQLSKMHGKFHSEQKITNNNADSAYTLSFILQGSYEYHFNGVVYPLHAPCVYLLKGHYGEVTAHMAENELINAVKITLKEEYVAMLSEQLSLAHSNNQLAYAKSMLWYFKQQEAPNTQLPMSAKTQQLLEQVWQIANMPQPTNEINLMQLHSSSLALISNFLTSSFDDFYKLDTNVPSYVIQAKLLLDNFYYENWTITQLARKVVTNECYLKRHFKQHTGMSIHQYRLQRRMLKAKEMLAQNIATTDIARQLGFSSHHYYLKVFNEFDFEKVS